MVMRARVVCVRARAEQVKVKDACKGGVCKSKSRAGRGGGVCNSLQGGEANGVGEGCRLVCRGATSTGCF